MKKRSIPPGALLGLIVLIAGCGSTYYYANRVLPPSGVNNRVAISVQNPAPLSTGRLEFVDAFYDIRHPIKNVNTTYGFSGATGNLPTTIQNLAEERIGIVYNSGDGSLTQLNYDQETGRAVSGVALPGLSSSVFLTRDAKFVYAANEASHLVTVVERAATSGTVTGTGCPASVGTGVYAYCLNVPGAYRVSVSPGGTVVIGFIQHSNQAFYIIRLGANTPGYINPTPSQPPANAIDCEPKDNPRYCAVPVPQAYDAAGGASPPPANLDRPIKAVFSADGSTVYILNCGVECGGSQAGVSVLPASAVQLDQTTYIPPGSANGVTQTIPVAGGAYNALVSGSTLYVAGQKLLPDGLFTGTLSVMDLSTLTLRGSYGVSDGALEKMVEGDDNTLWIGSTRCNLGERFEVAQGGSTAPYGCLTMFNTATNAVTLDSYKGPLTGIAPVTTLHKVYVAEGGQVHIYKTADFSELDNNQVTVTGTAYDVAYIDATSDANNTDY